MATTSAAGVGPPKAGGHTGPEAATEQVRYSSPAGHDLAIGPDGAWRPGWDRVVGSLLGLGPDELERRQRAADRLMVAEGASAVLHDDVTASVRPWRIDVVPLVLDAATWAALAAGRTQGEHGFLQRGPPAHEW